MNVLVIVAHPDDELIGCGATLRKLADQGHAIAVCVLCAAVEARHNRPARAELARSIAASRRIIGIGDSLHFDFKNIQFNTVPHLAIVQAIERSIVQFEPAWVFTHHPADLNIDHRVCYEAAMAALMLPQRLSRPLSPTMIRRVLLFEIPSSTDWAPPLGPAFQPNCFFDVKATYDAKICALAAFAGALKPFPHSRSKENLRHLAHLRGAQAGLELAEAFAIVRDVNL